MDALGYRVQPEFHSTEKRGYALKSQVGANKEQLSGVNQQQTMRGMHPGMRPAVSHFAVNRSAHPHPQPHQRILGGAAQATGHGGRGAQNLPRDQDHHQRQRHAWTAREDAPVAPPVEAPGGGASAAPANGFEEAQRWREERERARLEKERTVAEFRRKTAERAARSAAFAKDESRHRTLLEATLPISTYPLYCNARLFYLWQLITFFFLSLIRHQAPTWTPP